VGATSPLHHQRDAGDGRGGTRAVAPSNAATEIATMPTYIIAQNDNQPMAEVAQQVSVPMLVVFGVNKRLLFARATTQLR
jgi:hypothetical protein